MARTILALAVGASALVAPPQSSKPVVAMKAIQTPPILTRETLPTLPLAETMPGVGLETGGRLWDPMGFATFSDESLIWF